MSYFQHIPETDGVSWNSHDQVRYSIGHSWEFRNCALYCTCRKFQPVYV